MNDILNQPIILMPTTSISIPVNTTVSNMLHVMFCNKMGSLELKINNTEKTGPQLVVSCFLSNEADTKFNSLTQMYAVKEQDEYKLLKELVNNILDDYYALEDEKILEKYRLREMEEELEEDWEEDDELMF